MKLTKHMNKTKDTSLLSILLSGPSPSGYEASLIQDWFMWMTANCTDVSLAYTDKLGQKGISIGTGPKKIVLSAHIDSIFARVQYVDSKGLVHLKHTGGTDREGFLCNEVVIIGMEGTPIAKGIVGKAPIHIELEQDKAKYDNLDKVVVNVGAESKKEAEMMGITAGLPVVYAPKSNLEFGKNRLYGTCLDDKIGVYIISMIAIGLAMNKDYGTWFKDYTVIILPLTQEEVGGMGAIRAARNINPDICINFDVEHAKDYISVKDKNVGDIELGKGGIISVGCDKTPRIVNALIQVCKDNGISYQTCASRNRGTDTVKFQTETTDCETALVSIPNIYMHTPVEVCDWRDVDSCIDIVQHAIMLSKL